MSWSSLGCSAEFSFAKFEVKSSKTKIISYFLKFIWPNFKNIVEYKGLYTAVDNIVILSDVVVRIHRPQIKSICLYIIYKHIDFNLFVRSIIYSWHICFFHVGQNKYGLSLRFKIYCVKKIDQRWPFYIFKEIHLNDKFENMLIFRSVNLYSLSTQETRMIRKLFFFNFWIKKGIFLIIADFDGKSKE